MQLREIRTRRDVTQTDLARKCGFKPSAICHFEAGRRRPSYQNILKLSHALQVSPAELMGHVLTSTLEADFESLLSELTSDDLDLVERFAKMLLARKAH